MDSGRVAGNSRRDGRMVENLSVSMACCCQRREGIGRLILRCWTSLGGWFGGHFLELVFWVRHESEGGIVPSVPQHPSPFFHRIHLPAKLSRLLQSTTQTSATTILAEASFFFLLGHQSRPVKSLVQTRPAPSQPSPPPRARSRSALGLYHRTDPAVDKPNPVTIGGAPHRLACLLLRRRRVSTAVAAGRHHLPCCFISGSVGLVGCVRLGLGACGLG